MMKFPAQLIMENILLAESGANFVCAKLHLV
jgi:hypothetical protein